MCSFPCYSGLTPSGLVTLLYSSLTPSGLVTICSFPCYSSLTPSGLVTIILSYYLPLFSSSPLLLFSSSPLPLFPSSYNLPSHHKKHRQCSQFHYDHQHYQQSYRIIIQETGGGAAKEDRNTIEHIKDPVACTPFPD